MSEKQGTLRLIQAEVRLSDTAEARRLRAMLKAVQAHEGVMAGLVEMAYTDHGFTIVVCAEGDEAAVGRALGQAIRDHEWGQGCIIQAMREELGRDAMRRVMRRAQELITAATQAPAPESPGNG